MTINYARLRDQSWGIRITSDDPTPPDVGDEVEVTFKNGGTKTERIKRVIWSGENDDGQNVHLCEIES